jgi:hypothetical protein
MEPGRWLWSVFGIVVNELDPRTQSHDEVLKSFCTGNLQCLGTSVRASRSMASAVITHQSTQVYGSIVGTCHMGSDISQRTAFLLYYYYLTFFCIRTIWTSFVFLLSLRNCLLSVS